MLIESDTSTEALASEAPAAAPEPAVSPEPAAAPEGAGSEASAEPTTLLEAAMKALQPEAKPGAAQAAEPAGETSAADTGPAQTPEAEAPAGEPRDGVPHLPDAVFKTLPKEARQTIIALRKQHDTLKPDADRGVALSRFLQETGITVQEYDELIEVGALMKRADTLPQAREKIVAKLAEIDRALGITLPEDLHQEVEQGFLPEDRARELSQTRAQAERLQRERAAEEAQRAEQAVVTELQAWESEARRVDPDFDRKLPDIQAKVRLAALEAQQAGRPLRSGAEAVRMARKAHEDINAMLASFRPAPQATRPSPSSAASAPATAPAPKTIYEAAAAGLRMR